LLFHCGFHRRQRTLLLDPCEQAWS
jgi:hypothetical protein